MKKTSTTPKLTVSKLINRNIQTILQINKLRIIKRIENISIKLEKKTRVIIHQEERF